jgi:2'-5' RNA ligase superfamily
MPTADEKLIAIDVLLEPDRTMTEKSKFINARLRENYRAGYELDAAHMPHVTLLQRFVRAEDLDAVTAAITKVLVAEQPTELKLTTKSLDYVMFAGLAVTVLVVERASKLVRLHHKITDAVAPFSVSGGTAAAFVGANAIAETVDWVETFVPKSSGENYLPHVTAGVATEAFLKQLQAAPFEPLTFKPEGVAVYQVGNFGTAAKKLWEYSLHKPLTS